VVPRKENRRGRAEPADGILAADFSKRELGTSRSRQLPGTLQQLPDVRKHAGLPETIRPGIPVTTAGKAREIPLARKSRDMRKSGDWKTEAAGL
jgi:hypothetical protein